MRQARLFVIGLGAVGLGLMRLLAKKRDAYAREFGIDVRVVGVADSRGVWVKNDLNPAEVLKAKRELGTVAEVGESGDALQVMEEVEFDVLVELTPTDIETGEPGLSHIMKAIELGRHVVTANKGPLAVAYGEIMEAAEEAGVVVRYEATAGGAMPVFNLVRETLKSVDIRSIEGVLNGTVNYILTRMEEEGISLKDAIAEAQSRGIAEADPSMDIEGWDTACKVVILANAILGLDCTIKDVDVTGIEDVTPEAIRIAEERGYRIKLIGRADSDGELSVRPCLVPKSDPVAKVRDVMNVVRLETDVAGDIYVSGRGAGPLETASAVMSDVLSIAKNVG
ncbi:homoserine dehydrogenase [Methanopyrus sp.]